MEEYISLNLKEKEKFTLIKPPQKITFSVQDKWFMELGLEGIKFNHQEFPKHSGKDFAKEFMDLLEKSFNIKFLEKE